MKLELTLRGTKIIVESDDKTTTTVKLIDDTEELATTYGYVPEDVLDFVVDIKSLSLHCEDDKCFVENQRVMHKEWGKGTVICKSKNGEYGVEFDDKVGYCHNCEFTLSGYEWGRRGTKRTSSWCWPSELTAIDVCNEEQNKHLVDVIHRYIKAKEMEMKNT